MRRRYTMGKGIFCLHGADKSDKRGARQRTRRPCGPRDTPSSAFDFLEHRRSPGASGPVEPTGAKRAVGAIEVGRVYATEDHMRIMGMDYGEKRIGIALSDELGLTAQGFPTIVRKNRRQVLEAIGDLIARYGVERIVLGYPIRLDGSEAVQCAKVNRFAATLRASFDLPVIRQDETLTTREAEDLMREAGLRRERRRRSVDRVAASLILQGYLNACRSRTESGTIHE